MCRTVMPLAMPSRMIWRPGDGVKSEKRSSVRTGGVTDSTGLGSHLLLAGGVRLPSPSSTSESARLCKAVPAAATRDILLERGRVD